MPVKIYVIATRLAASVDEVQENVFNAYPNPAREEITFSFNADAEKNCVIKIFDLNGREVEMLTLNSIIGCGGFFVQSNLALIGLLLL